MHLKFLQCYQLDHYSEDYSGVHNFSKYKRMDVVKHLDTGCYVKGTNKHKYLCLNKACLLHSWICIKHTKENRPLLEAQHKEATNGNQMMPFLRPTTVHTGFSYTCYSKYLNKFNWTQQLPNQIS